MSNHEPIPLVERHGFELNSGDLPEGWVGHCDKCVQPITAEPWWQTAFNWLCFKIVLAMPVFWSPLRLWSHAGAYAYSCRCPNRRQALSLIRERGQ